MCSSDLLTCGLVLGEALEEGLPSTAGFAALSFSAWALLDTLSHTMITSLSSSSPGGGMIPFSSFSLLGDRRQERKPLDSQNDSKDRAMQDLTCLA